MVQITHAGITFEVYANIQTAENYLFGSIELLEAWAAIRNNDLKARGLITATRQLDSLQWPGVRASNTQPLAWPRTGVTDRAGQAVDPNTVPDAIINASILLAARLISAPSLSARRVSQGNVRRVRAGTAEVQFFRRTNPSSLPDDVRAVLAPLIQPIRARIQSFGTDGESIFEDRRTFDKTAGFS